MSIIDKKGINVTSGFKLVAPTPIDARFIAQDENDLQSLIDNGAVYNGLVVWVNSLSKQMVYNGTEFIEVASGGSSGGSSGPTLLYENTITLDRRTNSDNSSPAFCPLNLDFLVNYNFNEIDFIIIETNIMNGSLTGKSFVEFYTLQNEGVIISVSLRWQGPIEGGQFSLLYDITSNTGFSFKYGDSVAETNALYDEALVGAQLTIKAYKY